MFTQLSIFLFAFVLLKSKIALTKGFTFFLFFLTCLSAILCVNSGYDIRDLFREAQTRWLKPTEVFFILQNHEKYRLTEVPPRQPTSNLHIRL